MNHLFGAGFRSWLTVASEYYADIAALFERTGRASIYSHEEIAPDVYRTLYTNGTNVFVNYGEKDAVFEGIRIAARDYVVYNREPVR